MIDKIKKLIAGKFFRNVLTVFSGTVVVQLVGFAFMPFITRFYGPEPIGILGVFVSTAGILVPIASLKYEKAIVLPEKDDDAIGLIKLSLLIAFFISLFTLLVLYIFKSWIVTTLQIQGIAPYLFFIPLLIFFTAVSDVVKMWLIRNEQFKITATISVYKTLIINSIKTGIGYFYPFSLVLVILETFGRLLQAFMYAKTKFMKGFINKVISYSSVNGLWQLARKHYDFAIFRAPQTLVNALSQSIPVLLLSAFFGPAAAGFFALGKKVLTLPASLISKSVGDVLYPKFAKIDNEGMSLYKLLFKATSGLILVGLIPYGIIILFGPVLFSFVFGSEWLVAGEYARWLSLLSLFAFAARPSIEAIPVLKIQDLLLYIEILTSIVSIASFLTGYYYLESDIAAVALFSLSFALRYIFIIIWVLKVSRK